MDIVSKINDKLRDGPRLAADIVLAPAWWFHNEGITFGEDFFFNPAMRVEAERRMERALYERWGRYGLGVDRDKDLPVLGAVHLAAGYLISEMLGCKVEYKQDAPPQVICANRDNLELDVEAAFRSEAYKKVEKLAETLKTKYGYVVGDVNWSGVLNVAIDLRGQAIFMDMFDRPDEVTVFFDKIAEVIERFTCTICNLTNSTSISVNRNVRHLKRPVMLHSECSHTMISTADYEKFLFKYDMEWGQKYRPYGIHYCGVDPHRYAEVFAKLPHVDFLDLGWGGDAVKLRSHLPKTYFNIRLSPVRSLSRGPVRLRRT